MVERVRLIGHVRQVGKGWQIGWNGCNGPPGWNDWNC